MRFEQNAMRGMALYAAAIFMIVVMNSFAKLISDLHTPIEIVFYRNVILLFVLALFLGYKKQWHRLKTQRPQSHIIRSVIGTIGVVLVIYAYKYLPIADATTLMYASPLIVTALSVPILGEKVGLLRWSAVLIGFIGILLIANPEGGGQMMGYLFGIAAAITVAFVSLYLRDLGRTEDPMTTVFWFLGIGTILTGFYMPFAAQLPSWHVCGILFIVAFASLAQQFWKTRALSIAQAATVMPLQFTGLIWAAFFGFVFYGDWPQTNIWIGSFIVIGANLFIFWRERQKQSV